MTPDEARREAERRFGDVERTRERLATIDRVARRPGTTRRMVERVRAGSSLRVARPAAQAGLRARRHPHARSRHRRQRDDVRHRRPPALPPAGVSSIAPERAHRVYFGAIVRRQGDRRQQRCSIDAISTSRATTTSFDVDGAVLRQRRSPIGVGEATRARCASARVSASCGSCSTRARSSAASSPPARIASRTVARSSCCRTGIWQTQYGGARDVLGTTHRHRAEQVHDHRRRARGFAGFADRDAERVHSDHRIGVVDGFGAIVDRVSQHVQHHVAGDLRAAQSRESRVEAATADLTTAYRAELRGAGRDEPRTHGDRHREAARRRRVGARRARTERRQRREGRDVAARRRVDRAAHRLRQRRQSAARARVQASPRDRGAHRARRQPRRVSSRNCSSRACCSRSSAPAPVSSIAQWGGQRASRDAPARGRMATNALADRACCCSPRASALVAGLLTGLAPVLQAGRTDVAAALKAGAREGAVQRSRLRTSLLVAQAALSVVLLVGAGLFVRSRTEDSGGASRLRRRPVAVGRAETARCEARLGAARRAAPARWSTRARQPGGRGCVASCCPCRSR